MKKSTKNLSLWSALLLILLQPPESAKAETMTLIQTQEVQGGYERSLFKHWVDEDGDGCDTRKEVLISEALTAPIIGARCSLSGGKWISIYDGVAVTNASSLDIDHVVPLAEAWRSGAWAWTSYQRTQFANDTAESRALIAVTASSNRSKGDSDLKSWLPAYNRCDYIEAWVSIKLRYALTFDSGEVSVIKGFLSDCKNLKISTKVLSGYSVTLDSARPDYKEVALEFGTDTKNATSTSVTSQKIIRLYGSCTIEGSKGHADSGATYICKRTATDPKLKWRR